MSDIDKAIEETRVLHRKSDLSNLAHTHLDLTDFRQSFNARIDGMIAEVEAIAQDEWPPEGTVWEIYNRSQTMTREVELLLMKLDNKTYR